MVVAASKRRRELGAFYTPASISDILCEWAIRSRTDIVLEPSFGGCGFLKSAVDRLKSIGQNAPQENLFGCDIDPNAFVFLKQTLGDQTHEDHFDQGDFLDPPDRTTWHSKFDAIVGNPPYVPYQKVRQDLRLPAIKLLKTRGLKLGERASLWAYFVALSVEYLSEGGRIAWVLPGSFLQSDYARNLRRYLAERFTRCRAFSIQERLFLNEGTDEETVILLAEGFTKSPALVAPTDITLTTCSDTADFRTAVSRWVSGALPSDNSCGSAVLGQISTRTRQVMSYLEDQPTCKTLSDFLQVRIGLVTGDNPFFLLTRRQAAIAAIPEEDLSPILCKFSYFDGLSFNPEDYANLLEQDGKALLINCLADKGNAPAIQKYLNAYPREKVDTVGTFKKRTIWCHPVDNNLPHAFFPVMHHLGPRLILNNTDAHCTNTLHRVFFKSEIARSAAKLISISLMTSFSQISAEVWGRKYGSGVLKHEPRDAEKIKIVMPPNLSDEAINSKYDTIDSLIRRGLADMARMTADHFILQSIPHGLDSVEILQLSRELKSMRERRVPNRKRKD